MFKIVAYYDTGNSFGSYSTQDELGVILNNLDEAKDCLSRAKSHYIFCKLMEKTHNNTGRPAISRDNLIKKYSKESWFRLDYPEAGFMFKDKNVSAFYLGYFETLDKLQIEYIDTEDDDLTFVPSSYY